MQILGCRRWHLTMRALAMLKLLRWRSCGRQRIRNHPTMKMLCRHRHQLRPDPHHLWQMILCPRPLARRRRPHRPMKSMHLGQWKLLLLLLLWNKKNLLGQPMLLGLLKLLLNQGLIPSGHR